MGTTLHTLAPNPGATKKKKRVGRGRGTGRGKTSTRGMKGWGARAGNGIRKGFEGGQMPLQMRLPKRGFNNIFRVEAYPVNLSSLEKHFSDGEVTVDELRRKGIVPRKVKVIKILGDGGLTKKLSVSAHRFSKTAIAKIEAAGGSITVLEKPKAEDAAPAQSDNAEATPASE